MFKDIGWIRLDSPEFSKKLEKEIIREIIREKGWFVSAVHKGEVRRRYKVFCEERDKKNKKRANHMR